MPTDRRGERRDALLALLTDRGLDGLIVTHPPNIRYLLGFTGSSGLALALRDETVFFSDFRYETQAVEEVGDAARIEIAPIDIWDRVRQALDEYAGIERLGFESQAMTVKDAERLTTAGGRVRFVGVDGLVERLRERKDPEEVAAIRRAAALAGEAFAAAIEAIAPGRTEREVAAALELALRRRGSEWHPFRTIVASGPRSALPHAGTTSRAIRPGDLLLLDFGAQVDGYCADLTRTVVVGAMADDRQRAIYEVVREAQRVAREHISAGMSGRDADALARSMIESGGFGDAFGHSLGHGVGLEVHEAPRLSQKNDEILPPGAVVTIEPGVYVPGWGGVRLEDDVHLSSEGPELLSDGDTELRELT